MKTVKILFIAMEIAMIIGVIMFSFCTNWIMEIECGVDWMFRLMIVLLTLCAVVFQREQQAIEWDEENEE